MGPARPRTGAFGLLLAGTSSLLSALAACVPEARGLQTAADWDALRRSMVATQLRARDITDENVLGAMARVPRHEFVPESWRPRAYDDSPLPIGQNQTISQPYIVAWMTQALKIDRADPPKVLEIGTGSGYQAAVLAELGCEVYSIEIVPELADRAREVLTRLSYDRVHVRTGDGYAGWPSEAPFPRIILTAAPPELPQTLVDQLAVGGILVAPVGGSYSQTMTVVRKTEQGVVSEETMPVRFVPMVGGGGS
jgi:protein-L-isoaspartate(D-aspartate) O-methyltransferase